MIHAVNDKVPLIHESAFIAWNAEAAGDIQMAEDSSLWFGATIRADIGMVRVGKASNIQDGAVVHVEEDSPCIIGKNVTIGHGAILHGCIVEDYCLIGMGAIVLDKAVIGEGSVVGAGALVTQGKQFPPRSLIIGSPARVVRTISDEDAAQMLKNNLHYVELAQKAKSYRKID